MAIVTPASSGPLRNTHSEGRINGGGTLGELLKEAREARGLTLERIARETRIPQRHLEALEHGNLSAVPAGFYQRAELRAYARAVGLDAEVAIAKLQSTLKPVEAPGAPRDVARTVSSPRPQTLALIAFAVVAGVFATATLRRAVVQPAQAPPVVSDQVPPAAPIVKQRDGSPEPAASTGTRPAQATLSAPASDARAQSTTIGPAIPTPVSSTTQLVVTTRPAGARVTVNGVGWGVTPVTIRHMPPGDKRIRVSKEGYASQERVLNIREGQPQVLALQLDAAQ